MRIRYSTVGGLLLIAGLVAAILVTPGRAIAADYVVIPGNQWLQGQGVDVYRYRQCVELPQSRLYPKFGWPTVYAAGNGGAAYIPEGSPGLIRYNPGSGYVPVPGDLIIENPYGVNVPYGHVTVVDYTEGNTIHTVQQNGPNARADYAYNGSAYAGTYGSVKCVMHAPQNGFQNPGSNPSPSTIAPGDAGFTKGGTPAGWYSIGGGIHGTGLYSYGSNAARDNWARWNFDLSKLNGGARYKVEAYVTSTHAGHTAVDYHINTHDGVQHIERNQNIYSNQWVDLGTYTLDAGSAWVELDDSTRLPWANSESDQICFDGMKLTYVAPAVQPAALSVTGPVTLSSGPYSVGKTITGSFTVKNTGGRAGTWAPLVLAFRGPSGENRDAVAASSIALTPGQSQTVSFSRTLDLQGSWTGFVTGMFSGSTWQSPSGATVAFGVGPHVMTSTTMSLSAPATCAYGSATLTGALKTASGAGLSGKTVRIEYSYNNSAWNTLKTVATGSDGTVSTGIAPSRRIYYRLVFPGDADYSPIASAPTCITPRVYVTTPSAPSTAYKGKSFTSAGYLKPRHTAGTYPVKIRCYRYERQSDRTYKWVLRKTVSAKAGNYSSYTRFSRSFSLPYRGRWRMRTQHTADTLNATTYSSWRYVRVK